MRIGKREGEERNKINKEKERNKMKKEKNGKKADTLSRYLKQYLQLRGNKVVYFVCSLDEVLSW